MFHGSLELARRQARDLNRWLLVTIHAPTDFASQAMNRDLWNAPLLQSFVKENFVFVQMIVGGGEERRYANFYPYDGLYPHVALIDPRTGERIETLLVSSIPVPGFKLVPNDRDMIEILGQFIADNPMEAVNAGRKRSSPKLEASDGEFDEKVKRISVCAEESEALPSVPVAVESIPPSYDHPDAIKIQFRLPNGQKHGHTFSPQSTMPAVFRAASAISCTPLGQFKLRTAEGELSGDVEGEDGDEVKKLHNTIITIIK